MVEGARLESVYTSKGYRGFESLSLRKSVKLPSATSYFYVYILQSKKDFSFYTGQCDDLDKRMSKHFDGMSKYTASKGRMKFVYFEMFATRSQAIKRERQIKAMKSKIYTQMLIDTRTFFAG